MNANDLTGTARSAVRRVPPAPAAAMRAISPLLALAVLCGAGCQTTPHAFDAARPGLDRVLIGNDLAEERCWAESVTMAHESLVVSGRDVQVINIYCGDWEWPSARVFKVAPGSPDLDSWSVNAEWTGFLDRRMSCPSLAGAATTILNGIDARLLSCKLHNGGWPYIALVTHVNGDNYLADSIEAALPIVECTIALAANLPADACAKTSPAVETLASIWRTRMHGADDLQAYYDAMTLGQYYNSVKAFAKAERQYRFALSVQERVLGPQSDVSDALMHLALELSNQQEYEGADALFRGAGERVATSAFREQQARLESYRALDAANRTDFERARSSAQLATSMRRQMSRVIDVPAGYVAGAAVNLTNVPYPIEAAQSLYIEAAMDARLGDLPEADRKLHEAQILVSATPESPPLWEPQLRSLQGLIEHARGQAADADYAWTDAAAQFTERAPGARPADLALLDLAQSKAAEGQADAALELYRTALRQARARNDGYSIGQLEPYFALVMARADTHPDEREALEREMFEAAQLVRSGVTTLDIARAAQRLAKSGTPAGDLLLRFQQAEAARARAQQAHQVELGRVLEADHPEREAALRSELDRIDRELQGLEEQLQALQPNYKQLLGFATGLDRVIDTLRQGEALLQVLVGEDGTLVFLVRDGSVTAYRAPIGRARIVGEVDALRERLAGRAIAVVAAAGSPQAQAEDAAFRLYRDLFDPVRADLDAVKHLVVVASGPLLSYPFGMFVTEPPEGRDLAHLDWLGRRMAISLVPSAQSFVYLRGLEPSSAPKGLAAFGGFVPGEETEDDTTISVTAWCSNNLRRIHSGMSLLPNTEARGARRCGRLRGGLRRRLPGRRLQRAQAPRAVAAGLSCRVLRDARGATG